LPANGQKFRLLDSREHTKCREEIQNHHAIKQNLQEKNELIFFSCLEICIRLIPGKREKTKDFVESKNKWKWFFNTCWSLHCCSMTKIQFNFYWMVFGWLMAEVECDKTMNAIMMFI
jgi:hypothetical protein